MKAQLMIVGFAAIALQGCSSLGVGKQEFSCSGMPDQTNCMSTRDAYGASNGGNVPTPMNASSSTEMTEGQAGEQPVLLARAHATQAGDPVVETFVTPQLPDSPVPVRTPAQVMRIWMASWEDQETGSLIAPGYIYTEIEPRKWVIGKTERAAEGDARVFKPLGAPSTQK